MHALSLVPVQDAYQPMHLFAIPLVLPEFQLGDLFLDQYRMREPDWGPVGYVTYKRTYARFQDPEKGGAFRLTPVGESEEWWQTCARVVEGTYQIQQRHCALHHVPWNNDQAMASAQEMYDRLFRFLWTPPGRGLWMMGTPFIRTHGSAALNNPLHVDTPVLTRDRGWVPLGSLAGVQEVELLSSIKLYGRDHTSNAASAVWVKASISEVEHQPSKRLVLRDNAGYMTELVSSENHRWFRRRTVKDKWERVATTELHEGDQFPLVMPAKNAPVSAFGAQHGFFFGDGTRSNGELHQFGDKVQVLEKLFGSLCQYPKHRRDDEGVVRNCPRGWVQLPTDISDVSYVYGFLAGYFAADGCVSQDGACSLSSSRKDELVEVARLFRSIGVRVKEPRLSSQSSNFSEDRELWSMAIHRHDLWDAFFLREQHLERWKGGASAPSSKYAKLVHVEDAGMQPVLCATVPEYEQFVVDGFILTSNCAFISTKDIDADFVEPFSFLMDLSMLGVGVGSDTRGAGKVMIKGPVRDTDQMWTIPDSREGWVQALEIVLHAYAYGAVIPWFNYEAIRPEGALIRGFGGIAAGPEPLRQLLEKDIPHILDPLIGHDITSGAIVDIHNAVGRCVVSGNVRRSAEIMLGEPDDEQFLDLKNPEIDAPEQAWWRWNSNNSVWSEVGMNYDGPAARTAKNGEPGYYWLDVARAYGRMSDPADYRDIRVLGGNPCLEQSLENRELCCLVETFPANHEDYTDYERTCKFAYLYAKTVTCLQTHRPKTNIVMNRNRRIGCSQSGIIQNAQRVGWRTHMLWCDEAYKEIQRRDEQYSEWLGIPRSIKTTSVKPSGTVSLLCGATAGIHYPISEYCLRRISFQKDHPLLQELIRCGYPTETSLASPDTTVLVCIPIKWEHFVKSEQEASMREQLENAAQLQYYWADNQVSCTVKFDPEQEGPDVKLALEQYEGRLKGISFLPQKDHGFKQAPWEPITKEQYEVLIKNLKPIRSVKAETADEPERYCDSDKCEIVQQ